MIIAMSVLGMETIGATMIATGKMDGGEMTYKNKIAVGEWISVSGCADCTHKECEHYGGI